MLCHREFLALAFLRYIPSRSIMLFRLYRSDMNDLMNTSWKPSFVAVTLALVMTAPAFAAEKKKKAPEYHDTVIASVAANSITITEDKTTRTFPISQFTEITLKGQRATLAALQPGMAVSVTLGTDGVTASRIAASDPPVHNQDTRKPAKSPKGWMK